LSRAYPTWAIRVGREYWAGWFRRREETPVTVASAQDARHWWTEERATDALREFAARDVHACVVRVMVKR
jgi:hypothetical protein